MRTTLASAWVHLLLKKNSASGARQLLLNFFQALLQESLLRGVTIIKIWKLSCFWNSKPIPTVRKKRNGQRIFLFGPELWII